MDTLAFDERGYRDYLYFFWLFAIVALNSVHLIGLEPKVLRSVRFVFKTIVSTHVFSISSLFVQWIFPDCAEYTPIGIAVDCVYLLSLMLSCIDLQATFYLTYTLKPEKKALKEKIKTEERVRIAIKKTQKTDAEPYEGDANGTTDDSITDATASHEWISDSESSTDASIVIHDHVTDDVVSRRRLNRLKTKEKTITRLMVSCFVVSLFFGSFDVYFKMISHVSPCSNTMGWTTKMVQCFILALLPVYQSVCKCLGRVTYEDDRT